MPGENEKRYSEDETRNEAEILSKKVESGEAKDYTEAEKQIEQKSEQNEKVGSLYNPERIRPLRIISDEQLDYLADHNVWSSEESQKEFDELNKSDNKTYISKSHPFFRGKDTEEQKKGKIVGWIGDGPEALQALRDYIAFKKGTLHPSPEQLDKIKHQGPYGHGDNLAKAIYEEIDYDVIKKTEREKMPLTSFALRCPAAFINGTPGGIMNKIDSGEFSIENFEQTYVKFLEDFLEVAPRLLTLLARNPEWDIRELEKYVQDKNIPNTEDAIELGGNWKKFKPLNDFARGKEGCLLPENGKGQLTTYMKAIAEIYAAIREYLDDKVKYENDKE